MRLKERKRAIQVKLAMNHTPVPDVKEAQHVCIHAVKKDITQAASKSTKGGRNGKGTGNKLMDAQKKVAEVKQKEEKKKPKEGASRQKRVQEDKKLKKKEATASLQGGKDNKV